MGAAISHFYLVYFQLKTMRQEDYMKTISDLELHYQEFIRNSQGSEMFGDDDKRKMQSQFTDAQKHYQTLVIQLPGHPQHQTGRSAASFSLYQPYMQFLYKGSRWHKTSFRIISLKNNVSKVFMYTLNFLNEIRK